MGNYPLEFRLSWRFEDCDRKLRSAIANLTRALASPKVDW